MKKILIFLILWSVFARAYDAHEDAEEIEETDNEEQCILEEEMILQRKRGPIKFK